MPPSSPEDAHHHALTNGNGHRPDVEEDGIHPTTYDGASAHSQESATHVEGTIEEPEEPPEAPDVRTRLLAFGAKYHLPGCGDPECSHGAYSPRPRYSRNYFQSYGSITPSVRSDGSREGYGGPNREGTADEQNRRVEGAVGDAVTDGLLGKPSAKSTTHHLAKKHGVRHERLMYVLSIKPHTPFSHQFIFRSTLPSSPSRSLIAYS